MSLQTEEYCETLTASSENSPVRAPQRVMRATQNYLNNVKERTADVREQRIHYFEHEKMKKA